MTTNWFARRARFAVFAVLFAPLLIALFGFVVMHLWNWLMPALFGWHVISFWQALGVLVLSRILFGGFRGRHGGDTHWRRRMMERWERMTPEEREKFRESFSNRGPFGPAAAAPRT